MPQQDQLRYQCTRCGTCCRWDGYVRVTEEEVDAAARLLGLPRDAFLRSFTRLTDDRTGLSLTEKPDGSCVFLGDDSRCRIQNAKPRQCLLFPNSWNFPGFRRWCRCIDTWETAASVPAGAAAISPAAARPADEPRSQPGDTPT